MKEESDTKKIANKYVIHLKKELGSGAFAKTYVCSVKGDPGKLLACKVMNKSQIMKLVPNLDYLMQRVREEAKAWKELEHPNIVKFEDCKETSNNIYIFIELCSGGNLNSYIHKNQFSVNVPQIVSFSKQLVSACSYMESKNILHRDIKPENIFIEKDQIKLGDFGLARMVDQQDEQTLKSCFTFAGTLHYMAPQILRSEKYPFRCDVWSVGVTIFMMFTNQLPFGIQRKDNSEKMILSKIQNNPEEYNFPAFHKQPQMVGILQKMLTADPHLRPKMRDIEAEILKI